MFEIVKNISGKKVRFHATVNGKRLTGVNYARKWEAERLLASAIEKYGRQKLIEMAA